MNAAQVIKMLEKVPPDSPVIVEHQRISGDIDFYECTSVNIVECEIKVVEEQNGAKFWASKTMKAVKIS